MARRRRQDETNDAAQDSFLDIVANIVGILIILVMVVAVRAKNAPVTLSIPSPEQQVAQKRLDQGLAAEKTLHTSVLELAEKIRRLELNKRVRAAERNQLALMVAAAEKMIEKRREELDSAAQDDFDKRRRLADAQAELDKLKEQYELTSRLKPEAVRVDAYPTPLSKMVHGHELHLQLRAGRITVMPWDEIISELKAEFERNINRMRSEAEVSGRIGPIGGFRVTYTIGRHDVSMREYEATGRGGSYIQLERFQLHPVSSRMGESIDVALASGSELRESLSHCRPGRTTVTAWVYPDSFDTYRRLTKELYSLGFTVAGRPMPEGELIGGSPQGSRSSAQ